MSITYTLIGQSREKLGDCNGGLRKVEVNNTKVNKIIHKPSLELCHCDYLQVCSNKALAFEILKVVSHQQIEEYSSL